LTKLLSNIKQLTHTIQLTSGQFTVCHGMMTYATSIKFNKDKKAHLM